MMGILPVTGPIFALIAIGWLTARTGLFSAADTRSLGRFVVTLALPALIFRAVASRDLGAVADVGYLAAYAAGSLATFGIGYVLSRRVAGLGPQASTFQAMGVACSNSGFVGYPILLIAMPALADTVLALNMVVENLVLIPLVLLLAERGDGTGAAELGRTLRRVATSPLILALAAGLAVAALPVAPPLVLTRAIDLVAQSSAAISLIVIGASLFGVPHRAAAGRTAAVVAGKLLLHPLAVGAAFALLTAAGHPVDPALVRAGLITAALPAMSVYPILAAHYGEGPPAAVAMLAMTILSFFTLGALLWLLGAIPA